MAEWRNCGTGEIMPEKMYFILDARAKEIWKTKGKHLRTFNNDPGRFVLFVGELKECCHDCNTGEYGDDCIITDDDYVVQEPLFNGKTWSIKNIKTFKSKVK